jgi:hypothetical protein
MKQMLASAVIVGVFACTAALAAQASSTPSSTPAPKAAVHRTTARATTPEKEAVTVTGCVQDNGAAQASSTSTSRAAANKYPSYMLANATGNNSAETSGSAAANAGSYILQGMDLSREIGQQVEVTATAMPASTSKSRVRGTTGSTEQTPPVEHLWVTSVKMVSPTCSGQP